jgi:Ca2+-binding RTX toxin-like protein
LDLSSFDVSICSSVRLFPVGQQLSRQIMEVTVPVPVRRLTLGLLLAVALLAAGASPEPISAQTTCFGREATITDHSGAISGTPGNDVIIGDAGPNVIDGLGGDDIICGLGGNDSIETPSPPQGGRLWADGGAGDDDVAHYGDGGHPAIVYGGPGHDLLMILRADGSFVRGDAGNDTIFTGTHADGKNRLSGGDGNDRIDGGDGPDQIAGGGGDDELRGEQGFDALDGGRGDDVCVVGPDGGRRERCERTR